MTKKIAPPSLWVSLPLTVLFCLALAVSAPAQAADDASYEAVVLRVFDGYSMLVRTAAQKRIKIRLYGIDTPALGQTWGAEARDALRQMLWQTVTIHEMGTDRYKRTVAIVSHMGRCINLELVAAGNAWFSPKDCQAVWVCGQIKMAETEAREKGLGLWAGKESAPPWEWRKRK